MKKLIASAVVGFGFWCLSIAPSSAQAPQLINYQGRLLNGTNLVNGNFGLSLRLFDAAAAGTMLYEDSNSVTVVDGVYSTFIGDNPTNAAFLSALTNAGVWVEVAVNGTALTPRERVTSSAYALWAQTAQSVAANSITAAMIATGAVQAVHLATGAVTGNKIADGTISNADIAANAITGSQLVDGTISNADLSIQTLSNTFWRLGGNAGTVTGTHFLGTTDNTPLEIRVNGLRAALVQPDAEAPTILLGAGQNTIAANSTSGSSILGGNSNTIASVSAYSVILGGQQNRVGPQSGGTLVGGSFNTVGTNAQFSTIAGGNGNGIAIASSSTIAGGSGNSIVGAIASTVAGGSANTISNASFATIAGGQDNAIGTNAFNATIGGGGQNTLRANSSYATIAGGFFNSIGTNAFFAAISGGREGSIENGSLGASLGGGRQNTIQASSTNGTIAGGELNTIRTNASASTIGGGSGNTIGPNALAAVIGGGSGNGIGTNSSRATIGGGFLNSIGDNSGEATVPGGLSNVIGTNAGHAAIGGGTQNIIGNDSGDSVIAGGRENSIRTNVEAAVIGGGRLNRIEASGIRSTIGGGGLNSIQASESTIAGGNLNSIGTNSFRSTVGGGDQNQIRNSASVSTIAGGRFNVIGANAEFATVGGGQFNVVETNSDFAVISGGLNNRIGTNAAYAVVLGGQDNEVGNEATNALAAGYRAKANHAGTFVWSDNQPGGFASTTNNQFLIRASGGVGIGTSVTTNAALTVSGSVAAPAFIGSGASLTGLSGGQLTAGTVSNIHLAANAVTSGKLLDGTIAPADLSTEVLTNLTARLASNVWASADATTNSVRRTGDTMSGALELPEGGLSVGQTQLLVTAQGNVISTGSVTAAGFIGGGSGLTGLSGGQLAVGTISNVHLASGSVTGDKMANGSISNAHIAANAISGNQIVDGTLSNTDLSVQTLSNTFWRLDGNAGTTPGAHFLGTTDNTQLEIRANNLRAMLIMPSNGAPNIILGAAQNVISNGARGASILGGSNNTIATKADYGVIAGGQNNNIGTNAAWATIGGGEVNGIGDGALAATIGGGSANRIDRNSSGAVVAGGESGHVGESSPRSFIGSGLFNEIGTNSAFATIGGGLDAAIFDNASGSTIAGGGRAFFAGAPFFLGNNIYGSSSNSTIGGGAGNSISNRSQGATLAGGAINSIGSTTAFATVSGGFSNGIADSAPFSVIPGGRGNLVGNNGTNAFAAGRQAQANHHGAFVWADDQAVDFASTAANQFLIRASGGVGIGTNAPQAELHVARGSAGSVTVSASSIGVFENDANALVSIIAPTNSTTGVVFGSPLNGSDGAIFYNVNNNRELTFRTGGSTSTRMIITSNGFIGIGTTPTSNRLHVAGNIQCTTLFQTSDRNAKENIAPLDANAVLEKIMAMPVASWNYKGEPTVQHVGPMAQDFRAAFGLGQNDTTIATVDESGVALAAIQALAADGRSQKSEIRSQQEKIEALEQTILDLRARMDALEKK